ncbi:MAG: adenosylcobalamin-dependent ribonucleoside-diphosphate reductase [Alphaproteobacteria bacterium]|nr:adenosylcobalamin-dependent ribonucleoside-diphosphate reductase [Alphaproteobacteria bacterium]
MPTDLSASESTISKRIWDMKYRLKKPDGTPLDASIEDSWRRVADALAAIESEPAEWAQPFYNAMADFRFLPAGRILAGAGTDRAVTLFNCFVMGTIPDSMDGIFTALREAALTLQQGGGIGYDFSTLRPKGTPVHGVGADASGPLSFMEVWDSMCRTVMSAGWRRGAMMATMRCDHPDIEAFVTAKQQPGRLTNFNLSVLVSDAFMAAVEADAEWELVFDGHVHKRVSARALWDQIIRATYDYAEPGVIFIDRINEANNLAYCETISATNPCGEQPLPPYGACDLGSINLARLVRNPFAPDAHIDDAELDDLVALAVRMLDNVIDVSRYPLEAQAHEARVKRRIGLGVTGLADALIFCGLRYGSEPAAEQTAAWLRRIRDAAYRTSAALAAEKGAFALFDREAYLDRPMIRTLPEDVREAIAEHGIRNALVTSIAPTGTISLLADNVSSGIEPVFAFTYQRRVLLPDGSAEQETVTDYALRLYQHQFGEDAAPTAAFIDAQRLTPHEHLVMLAACQPYIDSAISKTINCPEDISFDAFKDVYGEAYRLGCKGCTTYRPSPVRGAVLSVSAEPVPEALPSDGGGPDEPATVVYMSPPLARPETLPGQTYKLRWPDSDHALYITLNDVIKDGRRRPFEIFINSKNMEHYAWTVALTRMISAVFRRGGDVSFVVEELKAVFDPRGGQWVKGKYVPSLLAAIGEVIERHMREIGFLPTQEGAEVETVLVDAAAAGGAEATRMPPVPQQCPSCGGTSWHHIEGCAVCGACGFSRCS